MEKLKDMQFELHVGIKVAQVLPSVYLWFDQNFHLGHVPVRISNTAYRKSVVDSGNKSRL